MLFQASLNVLLTVSLAAASQASWGIKSLNHSVDGRLRVNEPFARPCFSKYNGQPVNRDEAACAERKANYNLPSYRIQFSSGYMYDQSTICASDATSQSRCLLDVDDVNDTAAYDGTDCRQGNLPAYYLDVQGADDISKAFEHAHVHGIELAVKNSGHSFVEDSTGKDRVALWTANLKKLIHHEAFVPQGCSATQKFHAITTAAGVTCGEAFEFADKENSTILCAYASTVGLGGGWVQAGGHSVLSNTLGLGADRVLQYTVVTPDGKVRVANKCTNADLFWALRGGGGGTFGVVVDSTHLVESRLPLSVASIGFPPKDNDTVYDFLELLFDTAVDLAKDGWGGHIYGNSIVYVTPKLISEEAAAASMNKLKTFAINHGGSANISTVPSWYKFFNDYVLNGSFKVGGLSFANTRLIPVNVFTEEKLRKNFKAYMRDFVNEIGLPYVPVDSPYLYKAAKEETSVHPVWYSSIWEWGFPAKWNWNSTMAERLDVARTMNERNRRMVEVSPGGGTYKNEASPFAKKWQTTFWGGNYEKLLKIKNKYDPQRKLKCFKCVGWTDADTAQSCYKAFDGIGL